MTYALIPIFDWVFFFQMIIMTGGTTEFYLVEASLTLTFLP